MTTHESGERSINEIVADLAKPIPDAMLKSKTLKGNQITYIPWHEATRLLDAYAPGWTYRIENLDHIKDKVVMIVSLTIPTKHGEVTRYASGNEDDVTSSYGDPFSNAESMALRRAAAKFGLGRYLYKG